MSLQLFCQVKAKQSKCVHNQTDRYNVGSYSLLDIMYYSSD